MRGTFQIRNAGSEPLEYQIQSSCGCTELEPRNGTVVPGGSQDVSLALVLPEYANSEQGVRVVVKSNDPHRPAATCLVTAKCPAPFEVTPKLVNFGDLCREDEDIESMCETLEIRGPGGKALDDPAQLRLHHESEYIQVAREATDDGALRLKVSLSPQTPSTELYDTLELRLGDSGRVVNVPMHVRVVEPISVVPSTVFLRIDPATGKYRAVDLLVVSRRTGTPPGRVSIVDGPEGIRIEDMGLSHESRRRARLVVPSELKLDSTVEIHLAAENVAKPFSLKLVLPKDAPRAHLSCRTQRMPVGGSK